MTAAGNKGIFSTNTYKVLAQGEEINSINANCVDVTAPVNNIIHIAVLF